MTGAAALGGVVLTQRAEARRAREAARRSLQRIKADRLRRIYEPHVRFAMILRQVASEKGFLMEDETVETRDARHARILEDGLRRLSEVGAAAMVEPGTEDVRDALGRAHQATGQYVRWWTMNNRKPGSLPADATELINEIEKRATEVIKLVTEHLNEFDEPI